MERVDELQIVAETIAAVAATSDLDAALTALLFGMARLTGAEAGGVRLLPDPSQPLGPCRLYFWNSRQGYRWVAANNLAGSNTLQALETGAGVYSADLTPPSAVGDFAASSQLHTPRPGSSLIVPLRIGAQRIGTVHADSPHTQAFRPGQLIPLQALADHAAGAVHQAQLRAEATARFYRLEVVQRISTAVNTAGDLDALLHRVLEEARAAVHAARGQIALVDPDRQFVRSRVGLNTPPGLVEATVRRLYPAPDPDEDMYAVVVRTGEQHFFDDSHPAIHQPTQQRFGFFQERRVLTPIKYGSETIGVLGCAWLANDPLSADDLAMLRLVAEQIGGAIARARLVEAEAAAREQLATALQASATIVYTYGLDGRLLHIAGPTESLLGWSRAEMIGRPIKEFIDPLDLPQFAAHVTARQQGDRTITQQEARLRRRDGQTISLLATAAPHMAGDQVVGSVGALTDVSAIRQLQEERDGALAARARADGAIRTGRSVAHELASPLGAVLGLAELLALDPRLPKDMLQDLQMLQEQVARVGDLLHRFGRIARYEEMPSPGGLQLDLLRASGTGDEEMRR